MIEWDNGGRSLFDLKTDSSESKDLATSRPEVAARLAAKLADLKQGLPQAPARSAPRGNGRDGPPQPSGG